MNETGSYDKTLPSPLHPGQPLLFGAFPGHRCTVNEITTRQNVWVLSALVKVNTYCEEYKYRPVVSTLGRWRQDDR